MRDLALCGRDECDLARGELQLLDDWALLSMSRDALHFDTTYRTRRQTSEDIHLRFIILFGLFIGLPLYFVLL